VSIHQTYSANPVFRLYRTEIGRWCARSIDGAIGGTFFDRAAALRFVERESDGAPMRFLDDGLVSHSRPF
jgi:hypothetical protein